MERAKKTLTITLLVLTVLLITSYLPTPCQAETYNVAYQLLDQPNGSTHYRLNVAIPQSLYEYYQSQSHRLNTDDDFAKFVTPHALEPIAENLWQIYTDDEDFANGVLMIVHQIPYMETLPVKYPVETMVENEGDCDLFSYIAASILKAGGLDVVLLYYKNEAHMNIGVSLSHQPYDARGWAYYVTYKNVKYYVAECTGGNWQIGWRVGECPDDLKQALKTVQVIGLENGEQASPGQVSASYQTLTASSISLTVSPMFLIQGGTVTISGQLSPQLQNETVVIYIQENNSPWTILQTLTTDSEGRFACVWNVKTTGMCYVRASWSGNEEYAGADSSIYAITIVSMLFVLLLTIVIVVVCIGVVIALMTRQKQPQIPEPSPPEIPS
ncbi:hypothetical protein CW667_00465 [Candidatus Bathyarchaeota archaeon]|nr:MAG: hypothetical protein CW667_00465 [Candidatus Bathyarchaeota archaeon]